jgi:hypothetical protein
VRKLLGFSNAGVDVCVSPEATIKGLYVVVFLLEIALRRGFDVGLYE